MLEVITISSAGYFRQCHTYADLKVDKYMYNRIFLSFP